MADNFPDISRSSEFLVRVLNRFNELMSINYQVTNNMSGERSYVGSDGDLISAIDLDCCLSDAIIDTVEEFQDRIADDPLDEYESEESDYDRLMRGFNESNKTKSNLPVIVYPPASNRNDTPNDYFNMKNFLKEIEDDVNGIYEETMAYDAEKHKIVV